MINPYPMYPQQGYPQYPVQMPTQNNAYPTQMNVAPTQQNVNANVGTPQIQDGGFVIIPDEKDVLTYPVQPGHCVRFKVVGKPIYFEKTASYSQFEDPKIDRYRLVKEEDENEQPKPGITKEDFDSVMDELDALRSDFDEIRGDINALKEIKDQPVKKAARRHTDGDD